MGSKINDGLSALWAQMQDEAAELGGDLGDLGDEVRDYAAARMSHLATLVGDPDFAEAAKAEAQNVLAEAAIQGVHGADAVDARVRAILRGAIAALAAAVAA